MELNTKMIGHCELDCPEGLDYCCICCPKKEECKTQCDDLDSYEYTENCPDYVKEDGKDIPKIHPSQKPVETLKDLINVFTDPGDVVIDPCAGSGSTLKAAHELGRNAFGFEIDRTFYNRAKEEMLNFINTQMTLAL